jgi:hypothetical protein
MKGNGLRGLVGAAAVAAAALGTRGAEVPRAPVRPDYASFRVVIERNIFNASRSGRQPTRERESPRRPARTDSFGLVGTMLYENGAVAFFDGSSADYRQALKPGGVIAGFQLETVRTDGVILRRESNTFELLLGAQMRRDDGGEWKAGGQFDAASFAGTGGSGNGASSAPAAATGGSGEVSDVLKRLMEKRERESQ